MSIEDRVGDRGFGLQTGCVARGFSYGKFDGGGISGVGGG
jgi:hypothetical protein